MQYDLIIIGAGPAGIFAAMETARMKPSWKILIIERGKDIAERVCPMSKEHIPCVHCQRCAITSGWGGAGAFSDGKLTLTTDYGGWLGEYIGQDDLLHYIEMVDQTFVAYGGESKVFGVDEQEISRIHRQAAQAGLKFLPARIRHLGTEVNFQILTRLREAVGERAEIRINTVASEILIDQTETSKRVVGVLLEDGEKLDCRYLLCAPGREGHEWFDEEAKRLGLKHSNNPVDIGVRVELPAVITEPLTDVIYESKFIYYSPSFDDQVRTFCMNPYGVVVTENSRGLCTVNGHSFAHERTGNTNFALLVSKNFTQPFNSPITYGKYIATLANLLGDGVLVQRLGDLLDGRRSTPERIRRGLVAPTLKEATPGDLSLVLPYRHLKSIIEMLEALDKVTPGVASRHTLLYGVEAKFYSSRLQLSETLETQVHNFFAAGDGAGVTRGLVQASASGIVAATEICSRG
ncbi:MAG: NAD(P)/FAD-dependent oxidoreductase [Symbiobacteriaceae bacterium]|nr:NAD(P)/FAD-dependent oxidoreductase [Symbiobacteriaceae bacterium]